MTWTRVEDRDRRGHVLDIVEYCPSCWTHIVADTTLGSDGPMSWGTRVITTFSPSAFDECSHCHREPAQTHTEAHR